MIYRNLQNINTDKIVQCLTRSFEGYFVKMPSDTEFWIERFKNARVDKALSWGAFKNEKLIGFIINGIDFDKGVLTAFNSGTGILPEFRGNQIVDKMYNYGITELKKRGVKRCSLEVIDKNEKAIRVYQRIGFHTNHKLHCFKGKLLYSNDVRIQEANIKDIYQYEANHNYSWDNTYETISRAGEIYKTFIVLAKDNDESIGYFIINPSNGYIAQLETKTNNWKALFEGISQAHKQVKINNIKEDRKQLLSYLVELNFENTINQIDMEMNI